MQSMCSCYETGMHCDTLCAYCAQGIISLWLITLAEDSTCRNNYFVHKEEISDNGESAIVLSGNEDDD